MVTSLWSKIHYILCKYLQGYGDSLLLEVGHFLPPPSSESFFDVTDHTLTEPERFVVVVVSTMSTLGGCGIVVVTSGVHVNVASEDGIFGFDHFFVCCRKGEFDKTIN